MRNRHAIYMFHLHVLAQSNVGLVVQVRQGFPVRLKVEEWFGEDVRQHLGYQCGDHDRDQIVVIAAHLQLQGIKVAQGIKDAQITWLVFIIVLKWHIGRAGSTLGFRSILRREFEHSVGHPIGQCGIGSSLAGRRLCRKLGT